MALEKKEVRFKNCDLMQQMTIREARDFLIEDYENIMNNFRLTQVTENQKQAILNFLHNPRVVCEESDDKSSLGFTHTGFFGGLFSGNSIYVYIENLNFQFKEKSFCRLANTMIHEFSHKADVPMLPDHNTNPSPNYDLVFLIGYSAENRCNRLGLNKKILTDKESKYYSNSSRGELKALLKRQKELENKKDIHLIKLNKFQNNFNSSEKKYLELENEHEYSFEEARQIKSLYRHLKTLLQSYTRPIARIDQKLNLIQNRVDEINKK